MRHHWRPARLDRRPTAGFGPVVVVAFVAAVVLLAVTVPAEVRSSAAPRSAVPTVHGTRPKTTGAPVEFVASTSSQLDGVPVSAGWVGNGERVRSGALERFYVIVRPAGTATGPLPVLVVLPGREMTAAGIARVTDFPPVAGRAVLIYPEGYGRSWNAGGCCGLAYDAGVDDTAFLAAVVHQVLAAVPGTSARAVYLAGFSNGGRMAYRMACADPGLFAGVAAVEAVPVVGCEGPHPVSIAIVAYQDDPLLSISAAQPAKVIDGFVEPRVDDEVALWRQLDGCTGQPTVQQTGTVTVTEWTACRDKTRVQYDLYAGGRHLWPRGAAATPSATELVWEFFR